MNAVVFLMAMLILCLTFIAIILSLWDLLIGRWSVKRLQQEKESDDQEFTKY